MGRCQSAASGNREISDAAGQTASGCEDSWPGGGLVSDWLHRVRMSDTFLGAISEASNGPDMDILDPPLSPEGMEVQSMARRHAETILIDRASDIHDRSVLRKASVAAAGSFPALLRILMARDREAF